MTWRYRYDDAHDMYDDDRGCDDECGHDVLERRREAERDRDAKDALERKAREDGQ